jgi:hypothetical protein
MSKGQPLGNCRTCGSEIVEFVNEGVFRDGECDACEYLRYRTQPELLDYCTMLLADAQRMAADPDAGRGWDWSLTAANLRCAIDRATGHPATNSIAAVPDAIDTLGAISNDCEAWLEGRLAMSADDLIASFQAAADTIIRKAA